MPGLVTLAELKQRALLRADMANSSFISDSEAEEYVLGSMGELYDLIIENGGHEVFVRSGAVLSVPGTSTYSVVPFDPIQVYKILDVTIPWDGKERRLRKASFHDRFRHQGLGTGWTHWSQIRYVENGVDNSGNRRIQFFPTPQSVHNLTVYFLPVPDKLFGTNPEILGSFQSFSGWTEYVVVDAAMKMLEKEESDTRNLQVRKALLTDRIRHQAQHMNHGDGDTVRDVHPRYWEIV